MPVWLWVVLLTGLAGLAIPAGGLLAAVERFQSQWLEQELRHGVIAFGGGVLLAAVSLVLVPRGAAVVALPWAVLAMAAGGVTFLALDLVVARYAGAGGQLLAMLTDFVPEAIALGAMFAVGAEGAPLLALLIALQNLPEGFNAFREIRDASAVPARRLLLTFLALVPLGPVAGLAGVYFLGTREALLGGLMLFAAAGILYLTFQDIAPQARLERHWGPPLGAVGGFLFGLVGHQLLP